MFCGNCGNQIDDQARFCPYCGRNVLVYGGRNTRGNEMPRQGYGGPNQNLTNERKKTGALKGVVIALAALLLLGGALLIALLFIRRKDNDYRHYIDLGNKYLADLNYDEAVNAFTKAIDIEPKAVDAYMGRADAYTSMEEYDLARADYEQAIEIAPGRREEIQIRIDDLPASGGGRDLSGETVQSEESPGESQEEPPDEAADIPVLKLETFYEEDSGAGCSASYCRASLGDGTDALFPELNSSIVSFSDELAASVNNEYNELLSYAAEAEYPLYTDLSLDLARSDENLISVIIGSENYSGGAHGYYSNSGATFDTKNGQRLTLGDICTDTSALADIVSNMLYAENAERFTFNSGAADLANTLRESYINPSNDSCWIIKPEGILFYFPPYSISFYAAGQPYMLVKFADYKDLFNNYYCTVKEEYVSCIPGRGETAMKADFDGDGDNDELTVTSVYAEGQTTYDTYNGFKISLNYAEMLKEDTPEFIEMWHYTAAVGEKKLVLVEILKTDGQHTTYVYDMTGGSPVKTDTLEDGIFRNQRGENGDDRSFMESGSPERMYFKKSLMGLTENGMIE